MEFADRDIVNQLNNRRTAWQESEPNLPFLSQQPKVGDPVINWQDFKKPRLRRFPGSRDDIRLRKFLGRGEDGLVIKARVKGQEDPVAVKIFHLNRQPPPINITPSVPVIHPRFGPRYYRHYQPRPHRRVETYWAFEGECMNGALLEKIEFSLQRATTTGQQIYLNPNPTTRREALENLKAVSTAGRTSHSKESPEDLVPFAPNVQITCCFGWTQFKGADINRHLVRTRAECALDLKDDETYYAIIYAYVPRGDLEIDTIVAQLDFFHTTGFLNVPFNPNNWLGPGVLVDFSDIVCPFASPRWWRDSDYPMNKEVSRGYVRHFAERGGLSRAAFTPIPGPKAASSDHMTWLRWQQELHRLTSSEEERHEV